MEARVAIMGCGPGGSYLFSLLRRKRPKLEVVLFDEPHQTACGMKGCAWGVSWPLFSELCLEAGIYAERYVLGKYDHVLINQQRIKADVAILDKPSFIEDILAGQSTLHPHTAELDVFDRVVDATGARRAYLSPASGPMMTAAQIRVVLDVPPLCPEVFTNSSDGYSWIFPLSASEAHLGALTPWGIEMAMQESEEIKQSLKASQVLCSCTGQIRCHGPVWPVTEGRIWGLGEAIGLVDPISGAGIVPAMTSARMMAENWESQQDYERQVWRGYSYMVGEARVMMRLFKRERTSYRDMLIPRRAFATIGIAPNVRQIVRAVQRARKWKGGLPPEKRSR